MPEPQDTHPQEIYREDISPEATPPEPAITPVMPLADAIETKRRITRAQGSIIILVVALTAGALLYHLLMREQLSHAALMFLGIPAVLAILLAFTPNAKSLTGATLKGITLFLLIIAPLLGEGYLCIIIASPLFYLVGTIVGLIADYARKRERSKVTLSCVAILIIPMCLEGLTPGLSFQRDQSVEATGIVAAPAQLVAAALAQSPSLDAPLPTLLRIGFPRPLAATGGGLQIGATRTIHFSGAEGDPPGDLISRVTESRPGYLRVETVSDTSKLTQWIRWQSSEVSWTPINAQHTAVTWRIHFTRVLDPAWYFTPWQRAAVEQAAQFMIQANATPHLPTPAMQP